MVTLAIRMLPFVVEGWPLDSCRYLESYCLFNSLFLGSTILTSAFSMHFFVLLAFQMFYVEDRRKCL